MADIEDKTPEEKPKMTAGILACLAFSTLAFLLMLVLLFEGRTPADAAGRYNTSAAAEEERRPTEAPREKVGLSERIQSEIRSVFRAKEFYENGIQLGKELQEAIEDITDAWGRLLNTDGK